MVVSLKVAYTFKHGLNTLDGDGHLPFPDA